MSFFVKSRKRKSAELKVNKIIKTSKKKEKIKKALAEEIESESESEADSTETAENRDKLYSSDEEDNETEQQKRLRLAKDYLAKLEAEEAEKKDEEDTLKEAVADRLKHDIAEQTGKIVRQIADQCVCPSETDFRVFRGHKLPVTCIVISPDDKFVFTASKDCNICKWNVETGIKVKTLKGGRKDTEDAHVGHTDHILALAISSDGKYLAAGDKAKAVKLWNPEDLSFIHKFTGHRGPVTGLAFRKATHALFSCSEDKTVKVWNVDELVYVETLFGHNTPVTGIDSLTRERAISAGGRDGSVHIWKIAEDSQLLFLGHGSSVECVSLMSESHFITGADDNSISLWSVLKKKPVYVQKQAHDSDLCPDMWISAVASLQYTDVVASGSHDGYVRLWKCASDFRSLSLLHKIPVPGFVNSLAFSSSGDFLVVGVGQEHRLGRWWRSKEVRNGWLWIPLPKKAAD